MTQTAMVTLHRGAGGVILEVANLPDGHVALVDGDAVNQASPGRVDAIIVPDNDEEAYQRAVYAFQRAAHDIVQLLPAQPAGRVEVAGNGLLAQLVRASLGSRAARQREGERPVAIVDTGGSPERIVEAFRNLDELGMLVLAGQVPGRDLKLNLYTDLHRRSLTVAGVQAPRLNGPPPPDWRPDTPKPERILAGSPVPPGAAWYLITLKGAGSPAANP